MLNNKQMHELVILAEEVNNYCNFNLGDKYIIYDRTPSSKKEYMSLRVILCETEIHHKANGDIEKVTNVLDEWDNYTNFKSDSDEGFFEIKTQLQQILKELQNDKI